jgi:tetratricopeptide (TPR) repeat protein
MRPRIARTVLSLVMVPTFSGVMAAQEHQHPATAPDTAGPPLYTNLGDLHFEITTQSPVAQQYFDQGFRLVYAFNHDEAIRSFKEGIKRDSTCAMCYWGVALALGPNINMPMDTANVRPAWEASQTALKYSGGTSPRELAFIQALTKRYSSDPKTDRATLDTAWAKAIGLVSYAYPKDDDAAALHGEALMDLRPWNYWTNGGKAKAPSTLEQVKVLARVVQRNIDHPGACHFYIHAIEASPQARKALPCAEKLATAMPGAGHLVHMPTHIYIKLGQWDLAADGNAHALHADQEFINERHPTGAYPVGYYPHNFHVMWYALNMLGRSEDAIRTARDIETSVPVEVVRQIPSFEGYRTTLLFTFARFSKWDEILREKAPPTDLRYVTGAWRYARGLAYTGLGKLDSAGVERDSLWAIAAAMPEEKVISLNSGKALLTLAKTHLAGEIAAKEGRINAAVRNLRKAIALEDALTYDEPPGWYLPIRQRLGEVLLASGQPGQAEKMFRADLVQRPENGWSLSGLTRSLTAQRRTREAKVIQAKFEKAWKAADVKLAEK